MNSLDSFLLGCRTQSYKKGEIILRQNDKPTFAYAIKRGIVKTYNLTLDGEEKSIAFSVRGELFPVSWIFGRASHALFHKEAHTDCELYVIEKRKFLHALKASAELAYELLRRHAGTSMELSLQINALEQSRAQKKLLATLQLLCWRYGKKVSPSQVRIIIPFTQLELANFVGLTRETTVMELQKLRELSIITRKAKFYTVDTQLLADYLDDDQMLGMK